MSAVDLTEAFDVARSASIRSLIDGAGPADAQERGIRAAVALIEAQVREMVAQEIAGGAHMSVGDRYIALMDAAQIARGAA